MNRDPDDTDEMLAYASTVPPDAPETDRCPDLQDPENEGGFSIGYNLRPATFFPTPFDLASEELDET